jgi:hypothetical protein
MSRVKGVRSIDVVPTEDDEEATFSRWLDLNHYTHFHVPQETYTTSWSAKRHNKKLGVKRGVPDHWVIVKDKNEVVTLVAIEMKRRSGGKISDEQFKMISELMHCIGLFAFVAYGADDAINIIREIEADDNEGWTKRARKFKERYTRRMSKKKEVF